ncbi:cell division control protein 42 homolog [Aplysia californica]|uniref:Cell division control protein 42 homolog n=1 Tax=Aplysia californica TaxID=6500 RepID=A0ABM0K3Q1_APLCA|nr:cell division control protein 42 homolog [Aplysia californica]XP_005108048.2 cell division control protein 42 homolog [Aplysia californica]XP_005108049.2 cell division control protein 42 homolog [Aplysia californica]XP_005108050.2 cell division control protein 42 homolog [Aplysia californica]
MAELRNGSARRQKTKSSDLTNLRIKCAILGDGNVGKSAMLLTYLTGKFPDESCPGPIDGLSEFDHLTTRPVTITHENTEVEMSFVDTYGQDEYDKLRERLCSQADVYLLCYDVSRPASFDRVKHHWVPEFRRYSAPDCPFLVVGLKTDIRSKAQADGSDITEFVTYNEGLRGSEALGATYYVECSAKNNFAGVKRVFHKAAEKAALSSLPSDLKRSSCVVS